MHEDAITYWRAYRKYGLNTRSTFPFFNFSVETEKLKNGKVEKQNLHDVQSLRKWSGFFPHSGISTPFTCIPRSRPNSIHLPKWIDIGIYQRFKKTIWKFIKARDGKTGCPFNTCSSLTELKVPPQNFPDVLDFQWNYLEFPRIFRFHERMKRSVSSFLE